MDQPQVDPKGKGVGTTESNYPDEHGYKQRSTGGIRGANGAGQKQKLCKQA